MYNIWNCCDSFISALSSVFAENCVALVFITAVIFRCGMKIFGNRRIGENNFRKDEENVRGKIRKGE